MQAAKRTEKCCFLSPATLSFDPDLQTRPSEGPNTSYVWICRKSVQRFPRYPPKTMFSVPGNLDLDIQTPLWIWCKSVQQLPRHCMHKQKSQTAPKQNLMQFTACGNNYLRPQRTDLNLAHKSDVMTWNLVYEWCDLNYLQHWYSEI